MRIYVMFLVAGLVACSGGNSSQESGGDSSQETADAGPDTCQGETDAELCQLGGWACGAASRTDRCGNSRNLSCGSCAMGSCVANQCELTQDGPCNGQCTANQYSTCTCAADDPCNWSSDGVCDSACEEVLPEVHFDDGPDCAISILDSLGGSCTSNSDCAAELTCAGGSCVCCDDAEEVNGQWVCHETSVPALAESICGVTRAASVANDYGQDALASVGVGCYSGSPTNYWCPPQLQCVSRVEADEFRCGCCAEVQGSFMCSYDVSFAKTFCLGIDNSCADGSCLDCIGSECEPECAFNKNGICDEPQGTGLCPSGTDFTDCKP
jgi:hypothetical protein